MARNVFLSFLGANRYVPCQYFPENEPHRKVETVAYVQEALLRLFAADFSPADSCYFFLTDLARQTNWRSNGQFNPKTKRYNAPNIGLHRRLSQLRNEGVLQAKVIPHRIPDGFSSAEVWEIFQTVFDCLRPGDRITLDITHAFRSLPMLGMALVGYAKALKNIEVERICYGAFEKLGPAPEVLKMPLAERNAPILNLQDFSVLQD